MGNSRHRSSFVSDIQKHRQTPTRANRMARHARARLCAMTNVIGVILTAFVLTHASSSSHAKANAARFGPRQPADITPKIIPPHINPRAIERISWSPHAELYRGFLTSAECDYFVRLAEPKLEKSTVVDSKSGGSIASKVRTSDGTFFEHAEDDVIASIEARIATWTKTPESHGEGFQVLRYEASQQYRAQFDYFHDEINKSREKGGQRMGTVLMYLSDVEEGGETVFPRAEDGKHLGADASACARHKVGVKPRKGDALFFRSMYANVTTDIHSEHAGCPVIRGVKFSATKWIHESPIANAGGVIFADGVCKDVNAKCAEWARQGECENNKRYMIGKGRENGSCMQSCNACPQV